MKIGLLPLYVKLYDDYAGIKAIYRPGLDPFYDEVVGKFERAGVRVVTSPFCRVKDEFAAAVSRFEREDVDCIVTLHMAYSPSLESIEALSATELPLVIFDTTKTYDFSDKQESIEISFCHGIHGVMDMCNLLRRAGKAYAIAAGHIEESDAFLRCLGYIRAAKAARAIKGSRVGSIGGSFAGMGDFLVSEEELKDSFGTEVVYADADELSALCGSISADDVAKEIESYKESYDMIAPVSNEAFENTARGCLAVRKWIEKHGLAAFTANFLKIGDCAGIKVMPFIEAGRAMARGIGYAGEGDVLTAAVTGALLQGFPETSFIEIFCPDWKHDALFISHMGEMNEALAAEKPEMKEIEFVFSETAENPVVTYGCFKSGEAVFANIYKDEDGFSILTAPVTVEAETTKNFAGAVRGWIKPEYDVGDFLEQISYAGVTHHSVLIYGARPEEINYFGRLLGLNVVAL